MTISPAEPPDRAFIARLEPDLAEWEKEGLVRPDQAEALRARYGLLQGETPRTLRRSRIIQVIGLLGAVLVGVGVILVVGANWQAVPPWLRIALLLAATAACYELGYRVAYRSARHPNIGVALLLLGSLLWGASIFLIAQTYQLGGGEGGEAKGVGYWFLGVLPLSYVLRSQPHLALALALGCVWLGLVMQLGFATLAPLTYFTTYLAVGIFVYGLGLAHRQWEAGKRFAPTYQWLGLLLIFGPLYLLSFRYAWWVDAAGGQAALLVPGTALAVAALQVVALLLFRKRMDRAGLAEAGALLGLFLLGLLLIGVLARPSAVGLGSSYAELPSQWLFSGLLNVVLLVCEVALISLGWARGQPGLASFGMFAFFVQVVTRYFDLFGTMLTSGVLFIGAGLLLVGLGTLLERSRRRLFAAMAERRQP